MIVACKDPSSIKVENSLSGAIIRNAEWGGVPIASQLLPGKTSTKINIYNNSYYDIDLPDRYPIEFYIDVDGDMIYLETKERFRLGVEENILIEISDTTEVINPLLEVE